MRIITCLIILLSGLVSAAQWVNFSPEGRKANSISFYVDNDNNWAVPSDGGTYLYHLISQSWDFYPSPGIVADASWMGGENTLVIIKGSGSWMEEGIYYLDPLSGNYTLIQYLDAPNFIEYNSESGRYFIGYRFGIKYSDNGTEWFDLEYFQNMNIVDLVIYEDHYVACRMDNLYGIYYSQDAGMSWHFSEGSPMISDLQYAASGKLYGIFPDNLYSSGIWSSPDHGLTWNIEYWVTGINCVGIDAVGNVFVGFGEDAQPFYEGIARWDSANQSLHYFNEGLGNLNINQITINPAMSAIVLFCCTDTGAYMNYNYVGVHESEPGNKEMNIWPNPGYEKLNIQHNLTGCIEYSIYDECGRLIDKYSRSRAKGITSIDCESFEPGIYIIVIDNGHERLCRKWVRK